MVQGIYGSNSTAGNKREESVRLLPFKTGEDIVLEKLVRLTNNGINLFLH